MKLHDMLTLDDMPTEIQQYAEKHGISDIEGFSIAYLYDLFQNGGTFYIYDLRRNRRFMTRMIAEHYRDKTSGEIQKMFGIPHSTAYSFVREVQSILKKPKSAQNA